MSKEGIFSAPFGFFGMGEDFGCCFQLKGNGGGGGGYLLRLGFGGFGG